MEYAVIVGLAALCLYHGWRLFTLRRGIDSLTKALKQDPLPPARSISPEAYQTRLRNLSSIALDTVTEASLDRDSEHQKREFLEALLNEIKDAIFIIDANKEIQFLNEAAKLLFPSDQPYTARAFIDVCRDHRIFDTVKLAEEVGAKISEHVVLKTIVSNDSTRLREVNLLIEAEPLNFGGEDAEAHGSWVLMRDVTSQRETEQIRRDFVANASHELRTPLSIINGYLETMDEPDIDLNQAAYRRAVTTMRKHGARISRIVDDMLTISKLENASDLLKMEPFDLRESLDEMITQLMPIIEQNHARVNIDTSSRNDWVLAGDRYYWDQIFFNLIENALKQNKEPGLHIEIQFREENGRFVITISDDGIGIPAGDIPLVFKRFYRVQKHHAQNKIAGTGLGLSIVKRAVEAHNGTVSVDSRPGVSTVFTISVPETSIRLGQSRINSKDGN